MICDFEQFLKHGVGWIEYLVVIIVFKYYYI